MAVFLLQGDTVDLAGAEARQWRIGKNHSFRYLVGRQFAVEERAQRRFVDRLALGGMEDRDDDLAEPFVGGTEYRRLGDAGQA